jgi:capsular polysaccharide biosynthesis protein
VNIFNNVKCVISLQGAGLANAVFCKPGTKIIEIKSINAGNEFLRISKFCQLNHYQISLKPIFKSDGLQNGLMNCPVNKVEYALKYLKII